MFRFENPQYLYLMAGIIVLAVIHYLSLYSKKRRLKEYGDPDLLKQLFVGVSRWRPEVKFWLCQLALASFIIALARRSLAHAWRSRSGRASRPLSCSM